MQRWNFADWSHAGDGASMEPDPNGKWVSYEDYQSLQAALREALDAWQIHLDVRWGITPVPAKERIAALRKQFLE